jgi:Domain of unknown function (DUF4124)
MNKSTRFSTRILLLMGGVCLTFSATPALAQIYKWVDDRGVENYSNQAPASRSAQELDTNAITLSIYEAPKPRQGAEASRSELASLGNKIDELQRQLEAEREAKLYAADVEARAMQMVADRCAASQGVDCNGIYDGIPAGLIPVPGGRLHRFHVAPGFLMKARNMPGRNVTALRTSRPLIVAR